MIEITAEKPVVREPEFPEVATARLLMGKRGSIRFDVPIYFNMSQHPEFDPFVDREHSNGVTHLNIPDVILAGRYIHFRDLAAEEFIRQNRLKI